MESGITYEDGFFIVSGAAAGDATYSPPPSDYCKLVGARKT